MNKKRFSIVTLILLSIVIISCERKARTETDDKESARVFVQGFYDWAYPVFKDNLDDQPVIMKRSKEFFSHKLREALEHYYNTPAKGDDLGLDFDPFMAGQDFWSGYETGNVKKVGNKFLVSVHDIEKGKSRKAVQAAAVIVTAEVVKEDGHWVINDFIYPANAVNDGLLELLKNQQTGT